MLLYNSVTTIATCTVDLYARPASYCAHAMLTPPRSCCVLLLLRIRDACFTLRTRAACKRAY
eukprot:COSAG05_NODE_156_length_15696_cov_359.955440_6_plen_62_part_00